MSPTSSGEAAEAARRRRERQLRALCVVCAALLLGATWLSKNGSQAGLDQRLAIACAALYLVPIVAWLWQLRRVDEYLISQLRNAAAAGFAFYWLAYPVWMLLHMGRFVPAPDAMILSISSFLAALLASLWAQVRG